MTMIADPDAPEEMQVRNLNGVPWYTAPVPSRRHTCWVQTSGWIGLDRYVRCACGAVCRNPCNCCEPHWMERNSRHPDPPPAGPAPSSPRRRWWRR